MTKKWGPPTWIFIHSFLELISDECYNNNKNKIVDLLKNILSSLPCADCANHAKLYLKHNRYYINMFPTKKHLQNYFYIFHNAVNERLKKPTFTDFNKYKYAKLSLIFRNFQSNFTSTHGTDFSNNMNRKLLLTEIRNFINSNNNCFKWYG